jgi:hypothetical protein
MRPGAAEDLGAPIGALPAIAAAAEAAGPAGRITTR